MLTGGALVEARNRRASRTPPRGSRPVRYSFATEMSGASGCFMPTMW